jgi:hypothetical protein
LGKEILNNLKRDYRSFSWLVYQVSIAFEIKKEDGDENKILLAEPDGLLLLSANQKEI